MIVGAGLAGSLLAWRLSALGARVTVVDDARPGRASPVAAGLLSPISGPRLAMAERLEAHLPIARGFYLELEQATGGRWFHPMAILRELRSAEEADSARQRLREPWAALHLQEDLPEGSAEAPFGRLRIEGGGWLDYRRLPELHALGRWEFHSQKLMPADLHLAAEGIRWAGRDFDAVVLATGFAPEWDDLTNLPWNVAAGDLLTVRIAGWDERHIRSRGLFTVPLGQDRFRAGATYERENLTPEPSPVRREALRLELASWTGSSVEVLAHDVGIRPVLRGRKWVAASLPGQARIFCLNGLGSKGALHAPALVESLARQILSDEAADPAWAHPSVSPPKTSRAPRLTTLAHDAVKAFLQPGDWALDATAGLGRDTECLAVAVGAMGRVAAFEIQAPAVEQTRHRLRQAGLVERVEVFETGHEFFRQHLASSWHGKIKVVMMNLGYLPGGDPQIHTRARTTLAFLEHLEPWLAPTALLSLLLYRGHEGGEEEFLAVQQWAKARAREGWKLESHCGPTADSPVLMLLRRRSAA